jgi:chitinase
MFLLKVFTFLLVAVCTVNAQRFKIVANVSGDAGLVDASSINPHKVTHLIYTYAVIVNGKVSLDTSKPNDAQNLESLCALRLVNPDLKVMISIGGEQSSADYIEATKTDEARELFIISVMSFVKKYKLDGVELFWLLNPTGKYENKFSTTDHYNYALLIEELRVAFDEQSRLDRKQRSDFYVLSVAGSNRRQYLLNSKFKYVIDDIDFINVQNINYRVEILNAGGVSGSSVTVHHTNLYSSRLDSWQRRSSDQTIEDYKLHGIPMHKLVLSISFHGKGFVNAENENHGLYQMSDGFLNDDLSYKNIRASYLHKHDYKTYWDKYAKAPYIYGKEKGIFISYDNKRSIRKKTQYIRKHKLGGAVISSCEEDYEGLLSAAVRRGLRRLRLPF